MKTKVMHSLTKSAWNVVGTTLGEKYKIARFPYQTGVTEKLDEINRKEAFEHAEFTSKCFNERVSK